MLRIFPYHVLLLTSAMLISCGDGGNERKMPDHYSVLDRPLPPVSEKLPLAATVVVEMIEVDGQLLNDWTLEHSLDPTRATPLRREVQGWIRQNKARIFDTSAILVQNKGESEARSVREVIYPSEYRYPIKTTTVTTTDPKKKPKDKTRTTKETTQEVIKNVASTGSAFEMREAGRILKVGALIDPAGDTVKIDLKTELVHYFENLEWQAVRDGDVEHFTSPVFEKNAYQTNFALQNGIFGLIGSGSLPEVLRSEHIEKSLLLVFVRADTNQPKL